MELAAVYDKHTSEEEELWNWQQHLTNTPVTTKRRSCRSGSSV